MSITVWHGLISQYFEFYLEEKLNLLGASVVAVQSGLKADAYGEADADTSPTTHGAATTTTTCSFQLEGPLRQLPSSFIDSSQEFMERLYFVLPDGYGDTDTATGGLSTSGDLSDHNPFLYGEVTSVGLREILRALGVDLEGNAASKDGGATSYTFVDLGSGTGKTVVEAAHLLSTAAATNKSPHHCIGIELDHNRAVVAGEALDIIRNKQDTNAAVGKSISFVEGDFLQWLQEGWRATKAAHHARDDYGPTAIPKRTILFCCGVGFGDSFVNEICDAIEAYRAQQEEREEEGHATSSTSLAPLAGAVLLFKHHPKEHPLYQSAMATNSLAPAGATKRRSGMTFINTSWMDEAPAIVLRW